MLTIGPLMIARRFGAEFAMAEVVLDERNGEPTPDTAVFTDLNTHVT